MTHNLKPVTIGTTRNGIVHVAYPGTRSPEEFKKYVADRRKAFEDLGRAAGESERDSIGRKGPHWGRNNSSTEIIGNKLIEAFKRVCWGKRFDERSRSKRKALRKATKDNWVISQGQQAQAEKDAERAKLAKEFGFGEKTFRKRASDINTQLARNVAMDTGIGGAVRGQRAADKRAGRRAISNVPLDVRRSFIADAHADLPKGERGDWRDKKSWVVPKNTKLSSMKPSPPGSTLPGRARDEHYKNVMATVGRLQRHTSNKIERLANKRQRALQRATGGRVRVAQAPTIEQSNMYEASLIEAFKRVCWGRRYDESNKAKKDKHMRNVGHIALAYERRAARRPKVAGHDAIRQVRQDAEDVAAGRASKQGQNTNPFERSPELRQRIKDAGRKAVKYYKLNKSNKTDNDEK